MNMQNSRAGPQRRLSKPLTPYPLFRRPPSFPFISIVLSLGWLPGRIQPSCKKKSPPKMSSRFESFELRNSRDKHAPQDDLPPPYTPYSPGISQSSLFLGLYLVIPGLIIASALSLGFKSSVAAKGTSDARPGQWLDKDGVTMAQWPSTLFPNQDELPLAVAALALVTAVFAGILLLFVKTRGPIQVFELHGISPARTISFVQSYQTSLILTTRITTDIVLETVGRPRASGIDGRSRPGRNNLRFCPQQQKHRVRNHVRHNQGTSERDVYIRPGQLQQRELGVHRQRPAPLRCGS